MGCEEKPLGHVCLWRRSPSFEDDEDMPATPMRALQRWVDLAARLDDVLEAGALAATPAGDDRLALIVCRPCAWAKVRVPLEPHALHGGRLALTADTFNVEKGHRAVVLARDLEDAPSPVRLPIPECNDPFGQ